MNVTRCALMLLAATALSAQSAPPRPPQAIADSTGIPAHGIIDGMVVDDDLAAIEGAEIRVLNTPLELRTSDAGRFLPGCVQIVL